MRKKVSLAVCMAVMESAVLAGYAAVPAETVTATEESSTEVAAEAATEEGASENAESTDAYLYGYTEMSYADFWYGELESPAVCDTFDLENPDLTAQSEEYQHYSYSSADDADPYAGVQKNTWDNDSGMYDAVSRATVGYGLFRASFANTVEVKLDDGTTQTFSNEIHADETAPTGYSILLNTTEVPGIAFSDITRLDTDNTTGYTPDSTTVYADSAAGYRITGLKKVPVKVKKSVVDAAKELTDAGQTNGQLEAFNAQLEKITFVDEMTSYACKELYANGIYGAREENENAQVLDAGEAYLGTGENKTKAIAHGDGYADLTMYIYLGAYDGYTRGSVLSLDEETLDTLYADTESPTYAANKENGDKLAGFMNYALNFQGAKLQWAGEDGEFDTEDDVFAGNMIHKDSYFSFNHGNYIEVSITNDFERFSKLGNGNYRVTLISEGYADVTVEADDLVLNYKTPTIVEEDMPQLADGETQMQVQLDATTINVSNDASVNEAYVAGLSNADSYVLSYETEDWEEIVVAEKAASVENNDGIITVTFDVADQELPTDIHYMVTVSSEQASDVTLEFHYAPAE